MKRVCIITGSRADYGLLEWPIKKLEEDQAFAVSVLNLWGKSLNGAFQKVIERPAPDIFLMLGDRYEVLGAATAAHLMRICCSASCFGCA
jgi:UDP-N-acetylglucosamine 2-epimerase